MTIEGTLDGKSFLQNIYVSATAKEKAAALARGHFDQLGAAFAEVAEVELASDVELQADEIQVSGRIFFG